MANTFGSTPSSGFGAGLGGGFKSVSGGSSSPGHSSFLGNLGNDIVNTVEGFGPGLVQLVEHPIKTGENIAQSYKDTYGPLFHGDFGTFWKHVREHPLGPILDATALLDFGASGLGRAVNLTSKAGEEGSLLRHLAYRPGEIKTELPGTDQGFVKATSANPYRRARQVGLNKIMQNLPTQLRFVGKSHQYIRSLRSLSQNAVAGHLNLLATQARAFDALKNTTERSVANALGHGLEFGDKKDSYLHNIRQMNPDVSIPEEMQKIMTNPEAIDLVKRIKQGTSDADVKRVLAYNEASKLAAHADAVIKKLSPEQARMRTYQHVMTQRGGRYLPKDEIIQTEDGHLIHVMPDTTSAEGEVGKDLVTGKKVDLNTIQGEAKTLTPAEAHDAILTNGFKDVKYSWMHPNGGEFDTVQLEKDLAAEGHPGVHYVPDKTIFRNESFGAGVAQRNAATESTRGVPTNHMETYLHGQLLLNQNLLGREFLGSIHVAKANAMFDRLWQDGVHTGPKNLEDVLNNGAKPQF